MVLDSNAKANQVISALRKLKDMAHIPNTVIAELNDLAFKAIKSSSLNKLVEKRAIANEDHY